VKRTSRSGLIRRVLLVDDDVAQAKLYRRLIEKELGSVVQTTQFPAEALELARRQLFDVIVIDVTINYGATPFGGLELYQQLKSRYGSDSLLAYSKFFDEDMLRRYNFAINFVEVELPVEAFGKKMVHEIVALRKRQRCFVAMPFVPDLEPTWRSIAMSVRRASFKPIRIDQQVFNSSIVNRIFDEVRAA
jgi:CheY-like chemotaxis protein